MIIKATNYVILVLFLLGSILCHVGFLLGYRGFLKVEWYHISHIKIVCLVECIIYDKFWFSKLNKTKIKRLHTYKKTRGSMHIKIIAKHVDSLMQLITK